MTTTKTNRSLDDSGADVPLSLKGSEFGTIDLTEIARLAADADLAAKAEPAKPKRTKKGKADTPDPDAPAPAPVLTYDPEFEQMIVYAVSGGVDALKEKLDWSEPGMHWREKVGACVSRLVQRIQPMQPGPMADVVTLLGYVAVWSVPNVAIGSAASPGPIGDNGIGQNVENAGATRT